MIQVTFNDIQFKCPHCGFINKWYSHSVNSFTKVELIHCDDESGGCGTQIVLRTELKLTRSFKALKIEGIYPPKELAESWEREDNNGNHSNRKSGKTLTYS